MGQRSRPMGTHQKFESAQPTHDFYFFNFRPMGWAGLGWAWPSPFGPLKHTLVRVGALPPNDEDLCNHFLDFLVLGKIVERLHTDQNLHTVELPKLQQDILNNATIIVSTLNNCGSSRLLPLIDRVGFVIIDEGENQHRKIYFYQ
jgi:hypothetical protein